MWLSDSTHKNLQNCKFLVEFKKLAFVLLCCAIIVLISDNKCPCEHVNYIEQQHVI